MTIGYWLVKGDRTTCGGVILEGTVRRQYGGHYAAMNGAKVSCGKHRGEYHIAGGHPGDILDNNMLASTLYSRSTCPCAARFVPSQLWARHGPWQDEPRRVSASPPAAETVSEPAQFAQSARNRASAPAQQRKPREMTLTLGVFFDGTGNNAINTDNMLKACTARHFHLADAEAEGILAKCAREHFGVSGIGATSYTGYYTNVYWLSTLYKKTITEDDIDIQQAIYIDGIGTEAGKPDSLLGQALGISDTGVIAKTDKAGATLKNVITVSIDKVKAAFPDYVIAIKSLQFDIFGFSRGAAAARHFANRIQSEEPAIIRAIREGMGDTAFRGAPAGHIRFIGLFDTVAAIGTPANGLNPNSADTGAVNLILRPGVAEKVFHLTAAHECRFNFALNSVKPAWPELALPGAHSDIGGGYLPLMREDLFLTRPTTDTVPLSLPGQETRGYRAAVKQLALLDSYPTIAPVMRTSEITAETWYDDRMPHNRYGELQKRSYAAITLRNRLVKNDWSKVALRVMLEAAQDAGVLFDPIDPANPNMMFADELSPLCGKALAMGKAVRAGQPPGEFSEQELDILGEKYIHCAANWNAVVADTEGFIRGGTSPSEIIGFINRPDENWRRTVYHMDGNKR